MKPDGIWEGGASYPGKPSCTVDDSCRRQQKTEIDEETPKRLGAEGGRSTDSTEDLGPMKLGNNVEEKTLTIRQEKTKEG